MQDSNQRQSEESQPHELNQIYQFSVKILAKQRFDLADYKLILKDIQTNEIDSYCLFFKKLKQQDIQQLNEEQFEVLKQIALAIKKKQNRIIEWIKFIEGDYRKLKLSTQRKQMLLKINNILQKKRENDFEFQQVMNEMTGKILNQNQKSYKHILDILQQIKIQTKPEAVNFKFCCTSSFILDEIITQNRNQYYQFRCLKFPLNEYDIHFLKRTICGFLNNMGGYIFIGINESNQYKHVVKGILLDEKEKQRFQIEFRKMLLAFTPNIINDKKYCITHIPITNCKKGSTVMKISIKPGQRSHLYSIKSEQQKFIQYWIRNGPETIRVYNYELEDQIIRRAKNPIAMPVNHNCVLPKSYLKCYEKVQESEAIRFRNSRNLKGTRGNSQTFVNDEDINEEQYSSEQ